MKNSKRANPLRTLWILLRNLATTANISISAVYLAHRGKLTRKRVDELLHNFSIQIFKPLNLNYKIFNPHQVEFNNDKRYMLMLNHTSLYDIPLTLLAVPGSVRMIAKKELFNIPCFGKAMTVAEHISIDRNDRRQAIEDLKKAKEKMEDGIIIWVAPEGTRSKDGTLGKFKKGGFITAIEGQALIVPLGIRGADKVLPPNTFQFHLNETAEVHIGEPIDASQYTLDNKEELMERVEKEIRSLAAL